jgi:hypothetical protein
MIGGTKAIKILIAAATAFLSLTFAAYPQGLGQKGGGYRGPPVEDKPKVDEKAYKSALDRIPTPDKKYDPWGVARPTEPEKPAKKSN